MFEKCIFSCICLIVYPSVQANVPHAHTQTQANKYNNIAIVNFFLAPNRH